MRRLTVTLTVTLAAALPALAACGDSGTGAGPLQERRPGTLTGVVVDAAGAPLPDTTVRVREGGNTEETTTGADGRFSIEVLPEDYEVTVPDRDCSRPKATVESQGTADVQVDCR